MRDPWLELPAEPPYLLEGDRPHVEAFNRVAPRQYRLDLYRLPGAVVGNRQAPLVILGLNPGLAPGERRLHRQGPFADALRANMGSDPDGYLHPGLLPRFANTPGGKWWRKCFKEVLTAGHDPEKLARQVLAVEFHGYHAKHWRPIPVTLPSQRYGFWVVEQAIDRGATIAVMRGRKVWEVAVPRLFRYAQRVPVKNPRSSTLSPRNCGKRGFGRVLKALKHDDQR